MPTVILIVLLALGLAAGFYVSQKAKSMVNEGDRTPSKLLYRQVRRQVRGWYSQFKKNFESPDDSSSGS